MLARRTALLQHIARQGSHYDWCFEDPAGPVARAGLVTFRLSLPSPHWAAAGKLDLERIADHRRLYLDYTGPISEGRGYVQQVDQGKLLVRSWAEGAACFDVLFKHFAGRIELHRRGPDRWQAKCWASGGSAITMR